MGDGAWREIRYPRHHGSPGTPARRIEDDQVNLGRKPAQCLRQWQRQEPPSRHIDTSICNGLPVHFHPKNLSPSVVQPSGKQSGTAIEIERQITTTENALALLLGESPRAYSRSTLEAQQLPSTFAVGVPAQLLSARPDVRVAEMALASCYYQTNGARAAFYPSLNISGSAGWTGALGQAVSNPMKFITSALTSLTQPIFANGKLVAGLRVAEAEEEKARLAFQQSLYNAGAEVSNALALYEASEAKIKAETLQIESLEKNVEIVETLFKTGKTSSYLEVITAQQALLQAQLSQIQDRFSKMQAVVNLYNALGGGAQ